MHFEAKCPQALQSVICIMVIKWLTPVVQFWHEQKKKKSKLHTSVQTMAAKTPEVLSYTVYSCLPPTTYVFQCHSHMIELPIYAYIHIFNSIIIIFSFIKKKKPCEILMSFLFVYFFLKKKLTRFSLESGISIKE